MTARVRRCLWLLLPLATTPSCSRDADELARLQAQRDRPPVVAVMGSEVSVNGKPAGLVAGRDPAARSWRIRGVGAELRAIRMSGRSFVDVERWNSVQLEVMGDLTVPEFKSVFQTLSSEGFRSIGLHTSKGRVRLRGYARTGPLGNEASFPRPAQIRLVLDERELRLSESIGSRTLDSKVVLHNGKDVERLTRRILIAHFLRGKVSRENPAHILVHATNAAPLSTLTALFRGAASARRRLGGPDGWLHHPITFLMTEHPAGSDER